MTPDHLLEHFDRLADAPDAIPRLRRFILDLAVRGMLVEQDPDDEPSSVLVRRIQAERMRMTMAGQIKWQDVLSEPDESDIAAYSVPVSWSWVSVSEVAECRLGKMLDQAKNRGTPRPYLRNINVRWFNFDLSDVLEMRFEDSELEEFALKPGDVLICEGGEPGRAAVWDGRQADIFFQKAIHRVRFDRSIVPAWFVRVLSLDAGSDRLRAFFTGTGIKHFTGKGLARYTFPAPPLAEQRRIVARVDELMELCDQLEAAQTERESQRDRLVAASLHRLSEPSDEGEDAQEQARFYLKRLPRLVTRPEHVKGLRQAILSLAVRGKLVDTTHAHCVESTVADFLSCQNGYAFKSEWFQKEGTRLCRNANVGHGVLDWGETARISEARAADFQRFSLKEGDIVLSLDRPLISTGLKVATVQSADLPCLLLQRVARPLYDPKQISPRFLMLWFQSPAFRAQIDPGRSNGVPHISTKQISALAAHIPPLDEQQRIVAKVDELMAICDQLEAQLTSTQAQGRRFLEAVLHEALASAEVEPDLSYA